MKFITYLGNKRKLAENICNIIAEKIDSGKALDLFSGSGVISYYLRNKGYKVWANDIANYSFFINKTYLEMTEEFLKDSYPDLDNYIDHLNHLKRPKSEYFFSKYYSELGFTTEGRERLFYTRENGLIIDATLEEIWREDENLRSIILCDLIYKMSKHVNTCGVFKAYYKEFGGRNADALNRIRAKIYIERPCLPAGPIGKSLQEDVLKLPSQPLPKFDVIYADPPYNQHQYSANYHLLEQACKPFAKRYVPELGQVSGIQPDLYKSPFCSKLKHKESLEQVIKWCAGNTRILILSYNSTSFIAAEEICQILEFYGKVEKRDIDYYTFRGGMARPGASRPKSRVKEYIFVLNI